ncbi:MAG: helix-turn-helix domain-containing protein [Candidatus Bathyarchaeota archaeon]|nr:helix-turn-helix domain-containing protein [Candidatus Bathyarchaeota archaeon]
MSAKKKGSQKDFETVVGVLGNPVRRDIIKKLSQGPDYTLRLSNELNINQQLAAKHLKVIQDAELVDVVRQKSSLGADKNVFHLNKFYSLQIDFSPSLYNERLISFNNPHQWIQEDDYMEKLEEQVKDIDDEAEVDDVSPIRQIIKVIDDELEGLEKRRARLLYIRNLALGAAQNALEEVDRAKRQVIQHLIDLGPTSVEALSKAFQIGGDTVKDIISELEREDIVENQDNVVHLKY